MLLKIASTLLVLSTIFACHSDLAFCQSGTAEKSETAQSDSKKENDDLKGPITAKAVLKADQREEA